MSLFTKSIKAFSWTFLGSIMGFIFQLIIARLLGASEFGKANVILGFAGTYYVFLNFGFTTLLIRESGKDLRNSNYLFTKLFSLYFLIDLISFPVIYLTLKNSLIKMKFFNLFNISTVLILILLFQISKLLYSYFVGIKLQHYASFLRDFLVRSIKILSFFLLFIFFSNYVSYLVAALLSLILPLIISLKYLSKLPDDNPFTLKWIYFNSWQFYLVSITYSLYANFSKILQKLYASNKLVGYLSVGITLGGIGTMLGSALTSVAMPEFAHAWKSKDYAKIKDIFKNVSRWNSFIMIPLVIFLIINLNRLLGFLGKDYSDGSTIVSLILLSQFMNSFVGPNGTLLNMSGYQRFELYNGISMIATGLISGFVLGPRFSWGIALSLSLTIITVNFLKFIEVALIHKVYPYDFKTFLYIIFIIVVSIFAFELGAFIQKDIFWFFINSILLLSLMLLNFLFSPIKNDRKMVINLIDKFTLKK